MELSALFSLEKLDHTKDNSPHLIVSLKAPTLDWVKKRPALCVIPLVDLSGSMAGEKLEYAKKSLLKLVDQLQPGDIAGLVGFESRAHVLVPPKEITAEFKTSLRTAINKLRTLGGTNLWDGTSKAIELVQSLDLGPQYLKRVIMFTDGQPTEGVTDHGKILTFLKETRGSVTLSAFGYGTIGGGVYNGCDQEFLTQFSQDGSGNYAYVQNPDDALTAFGRELGGLISTYAQDLTVAIEPSNGQQITKAVTNITYEQNALGETDFKVSDILSEETRHFVFETVLPKQEKHGIRQVNVFTVKVSYTVLTEQGKREVRTVEARAKAQFVEPGEEQNTPDKAVDEILAMAQLVRAQLEAEEKAKRGDYQSAGQILEKYAVDAGRRGHANTGRVAHALRARVESQSAYAGSEGFLRSMSYGATRGMGLSGMDAEAAQHLADCGVVTANASMTTSTQRFHEGVGINVQAPAIPWVGLDPAVGLAGAPLVMPMTTSLGSGGAVPLIIPTGLTAEEEKTPVTPEEG